MSERLIDEQLPPTPERFIDFIERHCFKDDTATRGGHSSGVFRLSVPGQLVPSDTLKVEKFYTDERDDGSFVEDLFGYAIEITNTDRVEGIFSIYCIQDSFSKNTGQDDEADAPDEEADRLLTMLNEYEANGYLAPVRPINRSYLRGH